MVREVLLIHSQLGAQKRHLECIPYKQVYPPVRNDINAGCHGNCRYANMYGKCVH